MKKLKKFTLALIAILLAMVFVTCESDLPLEDVEYTDVVYSADGGQVTVYLDGYKVPVTKSQRAMTGELAKMTYDYIEVVFATASNAIIARAAWELGFPAGITGVGRSVDYVNLGGTAPYACMFVGKKDGKTLLGVGGLCYVDGVAGTTVSATAKSVTFVISPIQTGLLVGTETAASNPRGVIANSFNFVSGGTPGTTAGHTSANASLRTLPAVGGVQYPMYALPTTGTAHAEYALGFATGTGEAGSVTPTTIVDAIKVISTTTIFPLVQRRTPRYLDGSSYREPRDHIDTRTTVAFRGWGPANNAALTVANLTIPLEFTIKGSGIFSFYLQIPVYNNTVTAATTDGTTYQRWYIRTGLGADLYSLDDGVGSGGCVLMGVGMNDPDDWLEIDWAWL